MLITFLNTPSHHTEIFTVYPPVGILSMSASLKIAGHSTFFIDADVLQMSPSQVVLTLTKDPPSILGITLNVAHVAHVTPYIVAIQQALPNLTLILGGPYVTGVQEKIFADFPTIKYAIVSEGEYAIIDFAEYILGNLRLEQVRNLLWQMDGVLGRSNVERIEDLDSLPLPDYSLVLDTITLYPGTNPTIASPSVAVMCTRGCPFSCTFCSSPSTWQRRVTFRSTDSIINELKYLRDAIGVREVFFQDDTMNAKPSWFIELCDKIIDCGLHREIFFKCPFRLDRNLLTIELLSKAKQANFWMIFYGVESGNQNLLNKMKKHTTLNDIKRAFALTRKAGIASYASLMVGNDGETQETVEDTIGLVRKIMPDYGGFAIAAPFPGSELHRIALDKKNITKISFTQYQFGECILKTEMLSTEQITNLAEKANSCMQNIKRTLRYKVANRNNLFSSVDCLYQKEMWHTWVQRTRKKGYMVLVSPSNATTLQFVCCADYPDISQQPVIITIYINGKKHSVVLKTGEWQTLYLPLQIETRNNQYILVRWRVNRTWNPKQTEINPHDDRELGITIERICIS